MNKLFNSKWLFLFFIITNYLIAAIIDHQPQSEISPDSPLDIEVFTDYSDDSVVNASLFYKTDDQIVYLQQELLKTSENYYSTTLPKELLVGDFLVYYILFELSNDFCQKSSPILSKGLIFIMSPAQALVKLGVFIALTISPGLALLISMF